MSVALTPYILNAKCLEQLAGSNDKSYHKKYFTNCSLGWLDLNRKLKHEGFQKVITAKMLFEDIVKGEFRFPEHGYLYAKAVEVVVQSRMSYDLEFDLRVGFKRGRYNNEWSPCNIKVLNHLPYKIPIQIPSPDDFPFVSTIYNSEIDGFLESLDLSDCTGKEGDEQFRSWFSMAKELQMDVVLFLW